MIPSPMVVRAALDQTDLRRVYFSYRGVSIPDKSQVRKVALARAFKQAMCFQDLRNQRLASFQIDDRRELLRDRFT